jgi:hypothetical protein
MEAENRNKYKEIFFAWNNISCIIEEYLKSSNPMTRQKMQEFKENIKIFEDVLKNENLSNFLSDSMESIINQYITVEKLLKKEQAFFGIEKE